MKIQNILLPAALVVGGYFLLIKKKTPDVSVMLNQDIPTISKPKTYSTEHYNPNTTYPEGQWLSVSGAGVFQVDHYTGEYLYFKNTPVFVSRYSTATEWVL